MDIIEHFKTKGEDIGCNMREIVISEGTHLLHMAISSHWTDEPPRFYVNGNKVDEETMRSLLS